MPIDDDAVYKALIDLQSQRAPMAALRSGAGKSPGTVTAMFRYIEPLCYGLGDWPTDCVYLMSSLFAVCAQGERLGKLPVQKFGDREYPCNFGWSLARLKLESGDNRMQHLLDADEFTLPDRLFHAVMLVRSKGGTIHWPQLLRDTRQWRHPDKYVQKNWAKSFWR